MTLCITIQLKSSLFHLVSIYLDSVLIHDIVIVFRGTLTFFLSSFTKNCLTIDRQFSFYYLTSFLILPLHDERYFFNGSVIIYSIQMMLIKFSHKITRNYLFIILYLTETL